MTSSFSGAQITAAISCTSSPSEACDATVAALCIGADSNSITCACINSQIPCAKTSYSVCSNNPLAYKPYASSTYCTAPLTCTNTITANTNTLVDDTMQICSAEQPIVFNMVYVVLFFVFVAILVIITTVILVVYTTNKII